MKKIDFRKDILPLKNPIFRTALRITMNREDAEDIVQDTMMKLWARRDEDIDNLEAFALKIARNLALDSIKKKEQKNITLEESQHDRTDENSFSPDDILIHSEGSSLIEQLLAKLPEKQRCIMQLRDIEGKNYKEIAGIMDISESDVKINLFRARNKIREQFTQINKYGL